MQKNSPNPVQTVAQAENSFYKKSVLPNGIRVVSETIPHVRSVSVGVWADVGSRDEDYSRNGISHFLEHMVFKGTRKRSSKEIAQSLESLGGYLNAFTTKEQTCFYARILDAYLPQALDVLSDLVLNATFKDPELRKERLVVIEELRNAEDDPEDIIHDYFEKAIFPDHSLGNPIIGTAENVKRFGRDDLHDHLKRHYLSSRMVIAAAGSVRHEDLVEKANTYFGSLSDHGPRVLKRTPGPTKAHKGGALDHTRSINQAHVCIGTISYSIRHQDRYPLLVLNALLGEGMSSRLYQTIREKHGLAYSVYSFVNMLSDTGIFGAYLGTDPKNLASALALVKEELHRLCVKAVSRAELERTKAQIKGTMMLGLENMSGRMIRLGSGEMYFGSFITLDTILNRVDAVTPEAVQRVATDIFRDDAFTTVTIRPS